MIIRINFPKNNGALDNKTIRLSRGEKITGTVITVEGMGELSGKFLFQISQSEYSELPVGREIKFTHIGDKLKLSNGDILVASY